jgi:hypothetical protein
MTNNSCLQRRRVCRGCTRSLLGSLQFPRRLQTTRALGPLPELPARHGGRLLFPSFGQHFLCDAKAEALRNVGASNVAGEQRSGEPGHEDRVNFEQNCIPSVWVRSTPPRLSICDAPSDSSSEQRSDHHQKRHQIPVLFTKIVSNQSTLPCFCGCLTVAARSIDGVIHVVTNLVKESYCKGLITYERHPLQKSWRMVSGNYIVDHDFDPWLFIALGMIKPEAIFPEIPLSFNSARFSFADCR